MTEYQFHWWPSGTTAPALKASVKLQAPSHLHGAALALKHFTTLGCDISASLAHVDITDEGGATHTLLVGEVVEWLRDSTQADFIRREGLAVLLR